MGYVTQLNLNIKWVKRIKGVKYLKLRSDLNIKWVK